MKVLFIFALALVSNYVANSEVTFSEIGSGMDKSYFLANNFATSWMEAKLLCADRNMTLVSLESFDELEAVIAMLKTVHLPADYVHLNAMTSNPGSTTEWMWMKTGQNKISYEMPWGDGEPKSDNKYCLCMGPKNDFHFASLDCLERKETVICEEEFL